MPSPLVADTPYYVILSGSNIKLALSAADATSGTAIDISNKGTGTLNMSVVPDSIVDAWETIDDSNNSSSNGAPGDTPWNANYGCDDSNFTDVSGTSSALTPSNATAAGASAAFSEIWQDNLSGIYFTNVLYAGSSGSISWADAIKMCGSIDSGDGSGQWRVPTQKELMQLYVNGASNSALTITASTWSSTIVSSSTDLAWRVSLSTGKTRDADRDRVSYDVLSVRSL